MAQIGRLLEKRYLSKNFLVYNWGAPTQTSESDLRRLGNNCLPMLPVDRYPDILIVHSGLNDAYAAEGFSKDFDSIYHSFPVRLNYMLIHYSLFYRCMWERLGKGKFTPYPQAASPSDEDYRKHMEYFKKRYRRNLLKILAICRSNDIKVIFSAHPLRSDLWRLTIPAHRKFVTGYMEFCEVEEKTAEDKNVPFVDLSKYFNREMDNNFRYFNDEVHFNLKGSKKAAEIFFPVIAEIANLS